ncbi:MAG TPA: hypothetical protein VI229_00320 [Burkholderiales bacterium]
MAQASASTFRAGTARRGGSLEVSNLAVSVPSAGLTTLLDIDVRGLSFVTVRVDPTVQALDALELQGKTNQGEGSYFTFASASGDYTSPSGYVVKASGNLAAQAAGSIGWVLVDVRGLSQLRVQASANVAGAATVSAYAGGR